jgi:hypothetical protein
MLDLDIIDAHHHLTDLTRSYPWLEGPDELGDPNRRHRAVDHQDRRDDPSIDPAGEQSGLAAKGSRGGMTSATIACDDTNSPAPPRPRRARKPMSCGRFCENPHNALPTRNSVIAARHRRLRPKASPSMPYAGIATAIARVYAIITQDMCPNPPSSPTTVGSAVATMIWSSAASRVTSSRQMKIHRS